MRNDIVALLRAEEPIRRLDPITMAYVTSFFVDHVESRLDGGARRHPLGFIVITEPVSKDLVLRYHLWPPDWSVPAGQENGQTHDHCFELNSLIIIGSLRQVTFRATSDPAGEYEIFEIDYLSGASGLRATALKAVLQQDSDDIFEAGTAYRLRPRIVHCVETLTRPVATLVLSVAAASAPPPRAFSPQGQNPPGAFSREQLDDCEIAIARRAIADLRRGSLDQCQRRG